MDQAADPSSNIPEYQQKFLKILNNRAKTQRSGEIAREKGFVVLACGGTSLRTLQKLSREQTYNHACMTALYRLQPNQAIGTLIVAFLDDMKKMLAGRKEVAGGFMPEINDERWHEIMGRYFERIESAEPLTKTVAKVDPEPNLLDLLQHSTGKLTPEFLTPVLTGLRDESVLRTGQRLVLFGELSEPSGDAKQWFTALQSLFLGLPERMGFVFSGAPNDFHLPTGDPHFLEIELPVEASQGEDGQQTSVYKYTDSSFHRDEPAAKDELNVNDYANAIARFILHPQTKPHDWPAHV